MKLSAAQIRQEALQVSNNVSRYLLLLDDWDSEFENICNRAMIGFMRDYIPRVNAEDGTRRKKSLERMQETLSERGLDWQEVDETTILAHIGPCLFHIRKAVGIDVSLAYHGIDNAPFFHCTASEAGLADAIESCVEVDRTFRKFLKERRLKLKRDEMISELELPSVELTVEQYLKPRGIRYILKRKETDNILEVQIVNDIWMAKPVNMDTLEDDLRLIPYLINRPDCIKKDGRGFKIFHKWHW